MQVWEEGLGEFLRQYEGSCEEYDEKRDGPKEHFEAIVDWGYDSAEEEEEGKPKRAAQKAKAVPKAKNKKTANYGEDGMEAMKLTKKEKAMVKLSRTHPSTFAITFRGSLCFIPTWLEEEWHHNEGVELFLDDNEDEVELFDPELDGEQEEYAAIAEHYCSACSESEGRICVVYERGKKMISLDA